MGWYDSSCSLGEHSRNEGFIVCALPWKDSFKPLQEQQMSMTQCCVPEPHSLPDALLPLMHRCPPRDKVQIGALLGQSDGWEREQPKSVVVRVVRRLESEA